MTTTTDSDFVRGSQSATRARFLFDNPFIALVAADARVFHGLVVQVPRTGLFIVLQALGLPSWHLKHDVHLIHRHLQVE
jgi:hypothetical protein